MTAAARREQTAADSGSVEAFPKRRAEDSRPPADVRGWLVFAVGVLGVASGGVGSLISTSYGRGEQAKRIEGIESAVREHGATLRDHAVLVGSFSTRMAVVEVNVVAIKESVARIEQGIRDERAERRNAGGPK